MFKRKWMWLIIFIGLFFLLSIPIIQSMVITFLYVLFPFFIAYILTSLCLPAKQFLMRHKWRESIAILTIIACVFSILSMILYIVGRSFYIEFLLLQKTFQQHDMTLLLVQNPYIQQFQTLPSYMQTGLRDFLLGWISQVDLYGPAMMQYMRTTAQLFIFCTLIPFLMFYMMKDGHKFKEKLIVYGESMFPIQMQPLIEKMEEKVGNYVKGQLYITLIMIIVLYVIYYVMSIKFAFMMALLMGMLNLIPFIGPIIGTFIIAFIASFVSMRAVVIIIIVHIIVQLLENSFLTPYILGKTVQLHPVEVLIWLLIGAYIANFIGLIMIIPLVLMGRVIIEQKNIADLVPPS